MRITRRDVLIVTGLLLVVCGLAVGLTLALDIWRSRTSKVLASLGPEWCKECRWIPERGDDAFIDTDGNIWAQVPKIVQASGIYEITDGDRGGCSVNRCYAYLRLDGVANNQTFRVLLGRNCTETDQGPFQEFVNERSGIGAVFVFDDQGRLGKISGSTGTWSCQG